MKIGIKYCGGCNPRYDRTEIARRILKDIQGAEIVSAGEAQTDVAVVICGCTSACAKTDGISFKHGKLCITHGDDYENLIAEIKKLQKQEEQKSQ